MKRKVRASAGKHHGDRIIERHGAFYWRSEHGSEHGPFPNQLEAVTDMQAAEDTEYEPEESPEQAEKETGMASWIDPDTGEPAEQGVPRIEDH